MGFAIRLVLFCALTTMALGASPKLPLATLLARMRTASGPVWRTRVISISQVRVGSTAPDVHRDALGLLRILRRCNGKLCSGNFFDGHRLYEIGLNDTPLAISMQTDFGLRGERTVASLAFLARDFLDDGGHIEDAGSASVDGRRFRLLLIANSDATPMQVYVDPATARIRYVRDIFAHTTLEYREYRDIGSGIHLPMEILRNGRSLRRYTSRYVATNEFVIPHPLAVTFAGPNATIATDPAFSIPIIPCSVGGVAAKCLLDSGNTGLAISLDLAERLQAPTIGLIQVTGLGHYATSLVRAGPLHFGNATLPPANYAVLDDIARDAYNVVLGADAFAAMRIEIDFAAHLLRLNPPPQSGGTTLPLHFVNFIPAASVQLDSLDTHLIVDTGDESNINLSDDFYHRHPTLFTATVERPVSGIGGASVESIGSIGSVSLGALTLRNQSIGVTQSLTGLADGHLGAAFFTPFKLILDYAQNQIQLIPIKR